MLEDAKFDDGSRKSKSAPKRLKRNARELTGLDGRGMGQVFLRRRLGNKTHAVYLLRVFVRRRGQAWKNKDDDGGEKTSASRGGGVT